MAKKRLSMCMITQNDENRIRDCIRDSLQYVDEIIVADLESSDQTVEAAKQEGADVYQIKWRDDFSEAKNLCLDHAKGRWVLFLQPNERISKEQWKEMDPLLDNPNAEGYLIYTDQNPEDCKIVSPVQSLRLFRNRREYRYQYRSFESIPEELITNIKDCQIRIHRLDDSGFPGEALSLALLQKELDSHIENCYLLYIYGIELINLNRCEESIPHFQSARSKVNPDFLYAPHLYKCFAWSCISLERDAEAFSILEEGIKYFPYYMDLLVLRAELLKRNERYEEAIRDLEDSLRIREHPGLRDLESDIDPSVILENLGELYVCLSDDQRAVLSYRQALECNPESRDLRMTLMDILFQKQEYDQVLEHLEFLEPHLEKDQAESIRFSCYVMLGESENAERCLSSIGKDTLLYSQILLQQIEDDWSHDRWQESGEKLMEMDQNINIDFQVKALYHLIQKVLTGEEFSRIDFEPTDYEIVSALMEKFLWFDQLDKIKLLLSLNGQNKEPSQKPDLLQCVSLSLDFIKNLGKWVEKINQKRAENIRLELPVRQAAEKQRDTLSVFYHCFLSAKDPVEEEICDDGKEELSCSEIHCKIGKLYEASNKKNEAFFAFLRALQWNPLNGYAQNKITDWIGNADHGLAVSEDGNTIPEGGWFQDSEEFIRFIHALTDFKKKYDKQVPEDCIEIANSEDCAPETLAYMAGCKVWISEKLTEASRRYSHCERLSQEKRRVNLFSLKNFE